MIKVRISDRCLLYDEADLEYHQSSFLMKWLEVRDKPLAAEKETTKNYVKELKTIIRLPKKRILMDIAILMCQSSQPTLLLMLVAILKPSGMKRQVQALSEE